MQDLRRPVARINRPLDASAPRRRPALRVGLLGGSFNPAHAGHRHISVDALRRLRLHQVWWLVSPQNPLKPARGMGRFADRLARARTSARHPRIRVSDLEMRLGTRYTADTLKRLSAWRGHDFVWLIGADNLVQLPRWHRWQRVVAAVPLAVFDRDSYSFKSLAGLVASRYARRRWSERAAAATVGAEPPAWVFLRLRRHPASSTALRRAGARARKEEVEPYRPPRR